MLKKNVTNACALSLALTAGMGGGIVTMSSSAPEAFAAEESVDNIYPSDEETEDSWKWGEKLTCDDILDEGFKSKLKEVGDVQNYTPDYSNPKTKYYKHPTEEELNNLEESSWDAPGDYTYLVEKYPENERPKLMKVKGKDKYFIASSTKESDRDPNIDKKNFYRLFEPENYLPKEMVEWKEDSKFKGYKYNAKLFDGFMDKEEYSPYGGDTSFMTRKKLKPEFMPEKGLSLSDRLDYFMKNDDIFSFDTSYYKDYDASKVLDNGRLMIPSRNYVENPETGKKEVNHDDRAFASCGPLVSVKPSSVSDISGTQEGGAKDEAIRPDNYLYPSDSGLSLRKTDESNKLLAGSTWKIKNLGTKEEFTVSDNKKPGNNDKNALEDLYKEDGLINVNLPEGRYELVESEAPEGYSVDDTPRKFIIHDRTGASFGTGDIVNKRDKDSSSTSTTQKPDSPSSTTPHSSNAGVKTPSSSSSHEDTHSNPISEGDSTEAPFANTSQSSPLEGTENGYSDDTSSSSSYQPQRMNDNVSSANTSEVGPEVNTGGNVALSFWDKIKGIFF